MSRPSAAPLRRRRGFSLVELLVTLVISLIVAGTIVSLMVGQMKTTSSINRDMLNGQSVRDNLAYMCDEINAMGNQATEPFVLTAEEDDFIFIGDVNNDGNVDRIEYLYDGGELSRIYSTSDDGGVSYDEVSTDTLIPSIEEFEFKYYTPGNVETDVVNSITSVGMRVKLDEQAGATDFNSGRIAEQEQATQVTIRNRNLP